MRGLHSVFLVMLIALLSGVCLGRKHGHRRRTPNAPSEAPSHEPGMKFGDAFNTFLNENGYKGGSVGVLLGNRLGYAAGFGHSMTGHNIRPETLLPVSSISKTITALAVLRLVQEGKLNVTDTVFGSKGILNKMAPFKKGDFGDARLNDITVDDLLRHAGGWDASVSDISDPMFNDILVERTSSLPNITKEMRLKGSIGSFDIIQYMLSRKLEFTPGTQSKVSNFGYSVLGRVIEEVTDLPYEEYVKENVLTPCGMWHTQLGPHKHDAGLRYQGKTIAELNKEIQQKLESVSTFYAYHHPVLVDSSHGWFSNPYDVMRLMQCLDGSTGFRLLNSTTMPLLTAKPRAAPERTENWFGAGVHVHHHGAIWVDGEDYTADVVLFHRNLKRHRDGDTYTGMENDPMAWVYLLEGRPSINAPLKQFSRVMIEAETHWPQRDAYFDDISDTVATVGRITKIVKLKVEEHKANSFLKAVQRNLYDVQWVNAFTHRGGTFITVVAEKNPVTSQQSISVAGLSKEKLISTKLRMEKLGFNMTSMQNYKSYSHRDQYMFLAQFRKGAYTNNTHLLYGMQHFDRPYKTLLGLYEEKGYRPLVQSLEYRRDDALISFILEEDSSENQKPLYTSDDSMSESKLESNVKRYAVAERKKLVYLDATNHRGKPRFSALFKETKIPKWLFSIRLTEEELVKIIQDKQKEGYLPTLVVGYSNKVRALQYAIYMEKPSSD